MLLGSSSLKRFSFSGRYVDIALDRPRWRFTADYLFHRRVNAGVEINPAADELTVRGNIRVLAETRNVPNVSLGTSSDRIGSPAGTQCYYITAAKTIRRLPIAPYASVNYSEWEDGLTFPFGATVKLGRGFSTLLMNDGRKAHGMLSFDSGGGWGASALWVWFERAGLAVTFGI
ncbi:MAG: hypothetical protein IPG71_13785 [bacterium]|nr:hypothetical protein [bacterium]